MIDKEIISKVVEGGRQFARNFHDYLTGRNTNNSKIKMKQLIDNLETHNLSNEEKVRFFFFAGSGSLDRLLLEEEQTKYTQLYERLISSSISIDEALAEIVSR